MTSFRPEQQTLIALAAHTTVFVLVVAGIVPRWFILPWTVVGTLWCLMVPVRYSLPLFVAAIPLFIALPLTDSFDSFNMWRLISVAIAARWFYEQPRALLTRPGIFGWLIISMMTCVVLSLSSVSAAEPAIRRVILLCNALLIVGVAATAMRRQQDLIPRMFGAMALSVVGVTIVAIIQLFSTYLIDIYSFMRIWGEGIQLRQFGSQWSAIVVGVGNTWFAYYGPQLSLRVFSLFTDSHTFPMYVLFGLSGLLPVAIRPVLRVWERGTGYVSLVRTRGSWSMAWVALALLMVILSGTRGIWAAAVGVPFIGVGAVILARRNPGRANLAGYMTSWMAVFVVLFAIAWPIATSPQFLLQKLDADLFGARLRSVIDFGETSNSARIAIWRATVHSIAQRPVLGIGPANFPVILEQDVRLGRAGSSAHNLWLHIAAESGVPAALLFIVLYIALWRRAWHLALRHSDPMLASSMMWAVLSLPWVAAYLLTDAALLDERVLLQFSMLAACISSLDT
jgi:hypothetical protein